MIRRVAFIKAICAGATGAFAWEAIARMLIWAGLPLMDIVHVLGTMFLGEAPAWQWWPLGMMLHAMVRAIWTIFYAYFFWSELDWSPTAQGAAFSFIPLLLAGFIMVPQMGHMHPLVVQGRMPQPGLFGWKSNGWGGPAADTMGHVTWA